jgi:hypothetical protein
VHLTVPNLLPIEARRHGQITLFRARVIVPKITTLGQKTLRATILHRAIILLRETTFLVHRIIIRLEKTRPEREHRSERILRVRSTSLVRTHHGRHRDRRVHAHRMHRGSKMHLVNRAHRVRSASPNLRVDMKNSLTAEQQL